MRRRVGGRHAACDNAPDKCGNHNNTPGGGFDFHHQHNRAGNKHNNQHDGRDNNHDHHDSPRSRAWHRRRLDSRDRWYSDDPGVSKALLAEIPHDTSALPGPAYDAGGGRTAHVDLRAQIEGKHCYQVSAVDGAGHEGQRSAEVCLPAAPPAAPSGFDVGIGGGSGEVMIIWSRGSAPDTDSYLLWFSGVPGDSKALLATVAHDPTALVAPAYNAGGGRTAYIDFPRSLENDRNCYQISAIDDGGNESPRTGELCLSGL